MNDLEQRVADLSIEIPKERELKPSCINGYSLDSKRGQYCTDIRPCDYRGVQGYQKICTAYKTGD